MGRVGSWGKKRLLSPLGAMGSARRIGRFFAIVSVTAFMGVGCADDHTVGVYVEGSQPLFPLA